MSSAQLKTAIMQLLGAQRFEAPAAIGSRVVVEGLELRDVRQIRDLDDKAEQALRRAEAIKQKDRARYELRKQDPQFQQVRAAWLERNREKVRAYKREYDLRTRDHQREQKTAWARRTYAERAERNRAASRAYYQRNREQICAAKRAKAAAARAAAAAAPSASADAAA